MKGDLSNLGKKRQKPNLDDFIESAGVDGNLEKQPDPKAKRDFKGLRYSMNEHEYNLLSKAAENAGLSLTAYIRTSWMKRAKEELKGTE